MHITLSPPQKDCPLSRPLKGTSPTSLPAGDRGSCAVGATSPAKESGDKGCLPACSGINHWVADQRRSPAPQYAVREKVWLSSADIPL